jgi:heat shock protein HslJ
MKQFICIGLSIVLINILITSCGSKKVIATFSDLDGNWDIIEMNGNVLEAEKTSQLLSLDIEQGSMSGNAGCNRMSGKIEYSSGQKDIIKFSGIVSTRMACMDMRLENELLSTLDKVVRFETDTDTKPINKIAFYGIDSSKLLVIEKR